MKLAASKKLRGERPDLGASNKVALRALEIAVGALERQWVITTEGQPFRTVYLQRLDKTWEEVSRHTAARVAEASTLDTFKLMNVTVFDSAISREDAQALDAQCAPDELYFAEPDVEFEEKRQRDWAHGEAQVKRTPKEETWLDAYRPLPLKTTVEEKSELTRVEIPEGRWYHSSQQKMPSECRRVMESQRLRAVELANEELELEAYRKRFEFRYQKMVDSYLRVKPQRDLRAQL